jgi:CRISPR-associated exonuclease Cas4
LSNLPLTESNSVLISALNEYVFCPRRCALKFIEGWRGDNEHTALGTLLHEHADEPGYETDEAATVLRGLPLFSHRYGLAGKADIVEVRQVKYAAGYSPSTDPQSEAQTRYVPVEYKKGRRRKFENDDVQLCAQAFCLEEMFNVPVPEGFVYHAASKRRRKVIFEERLRLETEGTIQAVRDLLARGQVPPAVLMPRCDGCSLRKTCMPELTGERPPKSYYRCARELWYD